MGVLNNDAEDTTFCTFMVYKGEISWKLGLGIWDLGLSYSVINYSSTHVQEKSMLL